MQKDTKDNVIDWFQYFNLFLFTGIHYGNVDMYTQNQENQKTDFKCAFFLHKFGHFRFLTCEESAEAPSVAYICEKTKTSKGKEMFQKIPTPSLDVDDLPSNLTADLVMCSDGFLTKNFLSCEIQSGCNVTQHSMECAVLHKDLQCGSVGLIKEHKEGNNDALFYPGKQLIGKT